MNGKLTDGAHRLAPPAAGERPIAAPFKLYPWEWMLREQFGQYLVSDCTAFIGPPWTGSAQRGHIYQAAAPLPVFDGMHTLIGAWVVAGEAAGMGMREGISPITGNTSRFVPHYFR